MDHYITHFTPKIDGQHEKEIQKALGAKKEHALRKNQKKVKP